MFAMSMVSSPFCKDCDEVEETFLHLFWDCPTVQDIWQDIICVMLKKMGEIEFMDRDCFMLNLFPDRLAILHIIMIIAKHYIYHARVFGRQINKVAFWKIVLLNRDIAEKIAIKHGKIAKFNKIWLDINSNDIE